MLLYMLIQIIPTLILFSRSCYPQFADKKTRNSRIYVTKKLGIRANQNEGFLISINNLFLRSQVSVNLSKGIHDHNFDSETYLFHTAFSILRLPENHPFVTNSYKLSSQLPNQIDLPNRELITMYLKTLGSQRTQENSCSVIS